MPPIRLDHLAVAGETLEEATHYVEATLGVAMQPGGEHARFATHNRLLGLADGLYLEAIAADPGATPLARPRWFALDDFAGPPRLGNWICQADDLSGFPSSAGRAVPLARGQLRWEMLVPPSGVLPFDNLYPAILRWHSRPTPGDSLPSSGCRLRRLYVRHPQIGQLRDTLPIEDERIAFVAAPAPSLEAVFETPLGERALHSTGART